MQKNVAFWMDCLSNVGQVHEFVQTNRLISNALLAFQLLLARDITINVCEKETINFINYLIIILLWK